tara:strand:- start:1999 stop:2142 length:144 start_codon:yes stop_codon:yes gene_type:complete
MDDIEKSEEYNPEEDYEYYLFTEEFNNKRRKKGDDRYLAYKQLFRNV